MAEMSWVDIWCTPSVTFLAATVLGVAHLLVKLGVFTRGGFPSASVSGGVEQQDPGSSIDT